MLNAMQKMLHTAGGGLTALLLTPALAAAPLPAAPTGVSAQGGRLMLTFPHHAPSVVAGVTGASDPCLSPDRRRVAYVRAAPGANIDTGAGPAAPNQIWLLDIGSGKAARLAASRDSPDVPLILAGLSSPAFSADGQEVFFLSAAWAVSEAVHAVSVTTRRVRFVCDGNGFSVLRAGRHRGMLVVEKHKYHSGEGGAYDALWLVSPSGQELRRWRSENL